MNNKEAKLVWGYMALIKMNQDAKKRTRELSDIEFKVLAYIGWRSGKAYINEVVEHPFFAKYSLSTIKRSILHLKNLNLIEGIISKADSRVVYLSIKEK